MYFNMQIYSKHCTNNWKDAKETWDDSLKLLTDEPNSWYAQKHLHLFHMSIFLFFGYVNYEV